MNASSEFAEYDAVQTAFKDDSVLNADKKTLLRFLMAVCRARPQNDLNRATQREQGELIRLLISAKDSEESHSQALSIAKASLVVSVTALIVALLQTLGSLIGLLCHS